MRNKFININFFILLILFSFNDPIRARKEHHRPQWEQILPEVGKEFLPEEMKEKVDKIFPPPNQDRDEEYNKKDKLKTYRGDKALTGKLNTIVKILGNAKLTDVYTNYPIIIGGDAEIKNSHLNHCTVKGSLNAKETVFKHLTAHGPVYLKGCAIKQKSHIKNSLTAEKSIFDTLLELSSNYVHFKASTTSNIKFLSTSDKKMLILEGSQVKGNILFEGAPGKVIIKKKSKIHGKIKNGYIEHEE